MGKAPRGSGGRRFDGNHCRRAAPGDRDYADSDDEKADA